MNSPAGSKRAIVLSRWWRSPFVEGSFVMRSVAGALSRQIEVEILVPGEPGSGGADGAFDLVPVGEGSEHNGWPRPASARWPVGEHPAVVVVEGRDERARELAAAWAPDTPVLVVTPSADEARGDVPLVPADLGLPVPISTLAGDRPHTGFGFTDYLLVLSDRAAGEESEPPTPAVAWLVARFPRDHVVVVEEATASAWWSRSLRGMVHIDTRTDLQRLIVHARAVVDLAPGPLVARECVESMRYGVPVIVPTGTLAAETAARGGGLRFSDIAELLACVDAVGDPDVARGLGEESRRIACSRHGRVEQFTAAVLAAVPE
jgi:hypothetical protein